MSVRRTFFRKLAAALFGLLAFYALFGWLAVPRIIQSQAEKYVSEKTGYHLSFDLPELNPFTLDLALPNLRLARPDGKTLLTFRNLEIDLSASGIFRRTVVFEKMELQDPQAALVLRKDGKSNWSEFIEKIEGGNDSSSTTKLDIGRFRLSGGRIDFADEKNGFSTRMEPLELDLSGISTWPGKEGRFRLSARTASGTSLLWDGKAMLSPLEISGKLDAQSPDMAVFSAYFKAMPMAPSFGAASLSTDCRLAYSGGKIGLDLEDLKAKIAKIRAGPSLSVDMIEAGKGRFDLAREEFSLGLLTLSGSRIGFSNGKPFLQIGNLNLEDTHADLAGRSLSFGKIALAKGDLKAVRNRKGEIDLPALLKASKKPEASSRPWHYRADKLELSGFSAHLLDQSVSPAASLNLKEISLNVEKISDNLSIPLSVRASLKSQEGGSLEAEGHVVPAGKSANLNLKIENLALKPAQPYLASFAKLAIASGKLDASGHAFYDRKGAGYRGKFALKDLRLLEKGTNHVFLAWKSLASRDLEATGSKLDIGTVDIDRPYAKLIISRNKSVNITRIILKKRSPPAEKSLPFKVNIDRIRISQGKMDYADYSLALPFGTRIHKLHGFVNGISSNPGALGQIQLTGQVDNYGSVRASGQIDLFDPKNLTDIKVGFRNIEMTRLTPYSATFAGRKIDSGKLTLNLDYKIKNHQLTGDNQIIMDNLRLGGRVESPEAKDLPLDLAIAILEDSEGRIDLGLPVSGNLDDPKFSYGGIIWKAISSIFEKIITAPFRALGALFGGGEKFENMAFDAGKAKLSPPELEKLSRLADAMNKRPRLFLTVHGVYSEADRAALQDLKARRAVALASGQHVGIHEDPGPLATNSPRIQSAIEKLFSGRFGKEALSKAGKGFEGREGDLCVFLFQRLREKENVRDSELQALGKARSEHIFSVLKASGAPVDRLNLESPEKVESAGQSVPAKLELGTAHD